MDQPTANFVAGKLVACYGRSCKIYIDGFGWNHLVETIKSREDATSAVKDDKILLIGGGKYDPETRSYDRTTEWVSVDGSPSVPGPFNVRHGSSHCTIQVTNNYVVVTGGERTEEYVTGYELSGDGNMTLFNRLKQGRYGHACGVYQEAGQQVG